MKNNKLVKIGVVSLIGIFIVTALVYKITTTNNVSKTAGNKANGAKQVAQTNTAEYDSIFKKDSVIDIKVELAYSDLKSILDNPLDEEYKSATVTIAGKKIENVGFRTKGNLTLRSIANTDSDRYSFRIKLDKYVDGQNVLGLDEFVVNNMYSDPSYMREYLSYEALREAGANVPETVFANLYINGKLHGFYLCVEAIDDSFLVRNFGSNEGNLYKQEQGSTLQYVEGSNYEKSELNTGKDETKSDLKNFIKVLNEMPEGEKGNIENVLDVDSALRYIAANTVLGNYDSYNGNMSQNYYLYGQNGRFTVIPWDFNMSFAGFGMGGDATTIPIDEPVMGVNIDNLPLIDNLLAVDEYKTKYYEYVKEFLSYLQGAEERITTLAEIIRPYVKADPTKFYTMEQFESNVKYSEASTKSNSGTTSNNNQSTTTPSAKPDINTAASQNTNGNQPTPPQGQPPQEGLPGQQPNAQNGNRPSPPGGGFGGNIKGGPNGGGGPVSNVSLVNYIRNRIENLTKQLSGELPTTGNTTMNSGRGGRGGK